MQFIYTTRKYTLHVTRCNLHTPPGNILYTLRETSIVDSYFQKRNSLTVLRDENITLCTLHLYNLNDLIQFEFPPKGFRFFSGLGDYRSVSSQTDNSTSCGDRHFHPL